MPTVGAARQLQLPVEVDVGPGVAEVGHPADAQGPLEPQADQMHAVGRSSGHDHVHRMLPEVLLQETHGRTHPAHTGIGDEEVAAHPQRHAIAPAFALLFAEEGGVHFLLRTPAGKPLIQSVGFADPPLDHLRFPWHIVKQARILGHQFGILRGVHHRLPTVLRQVLHELQPALHAGTAIGRPVVGDDQDALHASPPGERRQARPSAARASRITSAEPAVMTAEPVR